MHMPRALVVYRLIEFAPVSALQLLNATFFFTTSLQSARIWKVRAERITRVNDSLTIQILTFV